MIPDFSIRSISALLITDLFNSNHEANSCKRSGYFFDRHTIVEIEKALIAGGWLVSFRSQNNDRQYYFQTLPECSFFARPEVYFF